MTPKHPVLDMYNG